MKSWKHMAITVKCASCGVEGTIMSMKDKDWVNVLGNYYCSKFVCRQMAAMRPFARRQGKAPGVPR